MPTEYVKDIEYELNSAAMLINIGKITDTTSNAVTTSGNCGDLIYDYSIDDVSAGLRMFSLIDLLDAKGIRIFSEDESHIGNHTITFTVKLEQYTGKTNTTTFWMNITEPAASIPDAVLAAVAQGQGTLGNVPELRNTFPNTAIQIAFGESWVEELVPYDADNDIVTLVVNGLDPSKPWITFDRSTYVLEVDADTTDKVTGTTLLTVVLTDTNGNTSE